MNRNDELEQFKTRINLVEYAMSQGYALDKKESSKNCRVLRRASDDDKIIVSTGADGHGIYFSVRNDADNGSIIDFAQRRKGLNLGQVRKELRPWIGTGPEPIRIAEPVPKPEPVTKDYIGVIHAFARAEPVKELPYLQKRGIDSATLADPRFAGLVRMAPLGAAFFPHYDASGLTGYEIKNEGFTGFASGGTKSCWRSNNFGKSERVVIVETAIDALSHAQLHPGENNAYLSFAGQMSRNQVELFARLMDYAAKKGAEIVIATDADEAGDRYAELLASRAPKTASVTRERPQGLGKDWNDQLQALQRLLEAENDHASDWGMEMR